MKPNSMENGPPDNISGSNRTVGMQGGQDIDRGRCGEVDKGIRLTHLV